MFDSIISAKALLPFKITYSWVPRLGCKDLGGDYLTYCMLLP
jgi:hypothetical protein